MLLFTIAAIAQGVSMLGPADAPANRDPIPLVERVQGVAGTPTGYQAYELRNWGEAVIGRAKTIEINPHNPNRIRIVLDGYTSLEPRNNVGPLAPSIIFLPDTVQLDKRVFALRAGPRVAPSHTPPSVVFTEIVSERTSEFRTYTFKYGHIVFNGTVQSLSLGNPAVNPDGTWAGGLKFSGTPDFTVDYSDSGEPSRIRVPVNIPIPSELLAKPH